MKRWLVALLFFAIGAIVFMPRLSVWYAIEEKMAHSDLYLHYKSSKENLFTLSFHNNRIYLDKTPVAESKKIDFTPLLFFNRIKLHDLTLYDDPQFYASSCQLVYSILHPLQIDITLKSNYGDIEGVIDLKKKIVTLFANPQQAFAKSPFFNHYFKSTEEGYTYALRYAR